VPLDPSVLSAVILAIVGGVTMLKRSAVVGTFGIGRYYSS